MSYLALLAGLALLFGGGEAMLRGAVGVAHRFGLSEVFVGIAIVGFATSAPELFVSVDAGLAGRPEIAVGNVVGSNTANLLLILGAGAMIAPIVCRPNGLGRDAAMVTFSVVAAAALSIFGGAGRGAGLLLALVLVGYIYFAFRQERAIVAATGGAPPPAGDVPATLSVGALVGLVLLGLAALAAGAECLIYGAISIAQAAGLSERTISISVVALGTSLPELATAIVAATRGQPDVAVGNVLGSCVFNVFGILGVTAMAAPIAISPAAFGYDVGVMAFSTALVTVLALIVGRIGRLAGLLMLLLYAAYIVHLFMDSPT